MCECACVFVSVGICAYFFCVCDVEIELSCQSLLQCSLRACEECTQFETSLTPVFSLSCSVSLPVKTLSLGDEARCNITAFITALISRQFISKRSKSTETHFLPYASAKTKARCLCYTFRKKANLVRNCHFRAVEKKKCLIIFLTGKAFVSVSVQA